MPFTVMLSPDAKEYLEVQKVDALAAYADEPYRKLQRETDLYICNSAKSSTRARVWALG